MMRFKCGVSIIPSETSVVFFLRLLLPIELPAKCLGRCVPGVEDQRPVEASDGGVLLSGTGMRDGFLDKTGRLIRVESRTHPERDGRFEVIPAGEVAPTEVIPTPI